ncbi:MAG: DUF5106 domain-containing protein, partial [Bacteroidetes bacterium]|nr:DUF5106 domain-containing protein [Bacteroidota bacterium]
SDFIRKRLDTLLEGEDSTKFYQNQLSDIDDKMDSYVKKIYKDHPKMFFTAILKSMSDVKVPPIPTLPSGKKDSTFAYRYTKSHYFDQVDLSDERLLNCPILHNKVEYYLDNMTPQHPDSIIKSLDLVIGLTKGNEKTFKYIVSYFINKYERSNRMGVDAAFVDLVDKYYR